MKDWSTSTRCRYSHGASLSDDTSLYAGEDNISFFYLHQIYLLFLFHGIVYLHQNRAILSWVFYYSESGASIAGSRLTLSWYISRFLTFAIAIYTSIIMHPNRLVPPKLQNFRKVHITSSFEKHSKDWGFFTHSGQH